MVHSDSKRQWLVCASAFLAQFAVVGFMMTGGVLYAKLIDEFKASRGATGIKSVCGSLSNLNPGAGGGGGVLGLIFAAMCC